MQWNDLLPSIIGADLEIRLEGEVYRGPVAAVDNDVNRATISFAWLAKRRREDEPIETAEQRDWIVWRLGEVAVDKSHKPMQVSGGRVCFSDARGGYYTVYPADQRLDPGAVQGLSL